MRTSNNDIRRGNMGTHRPSKEQVIAAAQTKIIAVHAMSLQLPTNCYLTIVNPSVPTRCRLDCRRLIDVCTPAITTDGGCSTHMNDHATCMNAFTVSIYSLQRYNCKQSLLTCMLGDPFSAITKGCWPVLKCIINLSAWYCSVKSTRRANKGVMARHGSLTMEEENYCISKVKVNRNILVGVHQSYASIMWHAFSSNI